MVDYSWTNWSYFVSTLPPAADTVLPLDDVKNWLRIPLTNSTDDTILAMLSEAAIDFGEKITRLTFRPTGFTTFRNGWDEFNKFTIGGNSPLVLRRSPLSQIDSIDFLVDDVLTPLSSSDFFTELLDEYSKARPVPDKEWPSDQDEIEQSVKIIFTAGFTVLPVALKQALLNHIAFMYENRGDCGCDDNSAISAGAMGVYKQHKIMEC